MIPETYFITNLDEGSLGIMPKPRGNDWVEDEILGLKLLKYNLVVSFLETEEEHELELSEEKQLCEQHGIEFISFPIPDRTVPEEESFIEFVSFLYNKITAGKNAIIHCRGGIGRAGITSVALLIKSGIKGTDAFMKVSEARGIEVPDTLEQRAWLLSLEDKIR